MSELTLGPFTIFGTAQMARFLLSDRRRSAGGSRHPRRDCVLQTSAFHRAPPGGRGGTAGTGGKISGLFVAGARHLERESRIVKDLIETSDHAIEVNDLSAIGQIKGRRHLVGPLVNVYNGPTARLLAQRGADRICLPPELPFSSIVRIAADVPGIALEVMVFGRMPLAISARCAHARSKGRIKDNCQFVCGEEPDGLSIKTLDRQSFLVLNGVQTMSHTCQLLLSELTELQAAGINAFRLSPQDCDMTRIAFIFQETLSGRMEPEEAVELVCHTYPNAQFSNGFHHAREGAAWVARAKNNIHAP